MATRRAPKAIGWLAAGLVMTAVPKAGAATLEQVNGWGVSGLPSDVTMHIYVPDNVATNPPVLALIHYCGGTASAVFGQAQGGGIVRAADQYGFIMVVPSSGRCWDVQSDRAWTRDGGGDSHAIVQMVRYAIQTRAANAQRVYATGDSSGGMMTELLLGLYPDIFKAGSAMAGMPAGCRAANESGNGGGYSGACAGGSVTRTPEEWGDIVRMMHPGYAGHRPRVQLFHGDADTIVRYPNHTEAIKQWTNVLELGTTPTSTTTLQLGNHQAERESWRNACGQVVLDAFTSLGGDHGPSDALFPAEHVIPFLGLDRTGPVDPEIEACSGGMGGAGGGGGGGAAGNGGAAPGGSAGLGGLGGAGMAGAAGNGAGNANGGNGGGAATSSESGSGGLSGGAAGVSNGGSQTAGAGGFSGVGVDFGGAGGFSGSGGTPSQGASGGATAGNRASVDHTEDGKCAVSVVGPGARGTAHRSYAVVALGVAFAATRRRRRRSS